MQIIKKINNRLFTNKTKANKATASQNKNWNSFFSTKKAQIFGKIGQSELRACEFFFRKIQPPFPYACSWRRPAERLYNIAGVFPKTKQAFDCFCRTYLNSLTCLDGLYLWQKDSYLQEVEQKLALLYCPKAAYLPSDLLSHDTLFDLHNFKWLIVSPFVETMSQQLHNLQNIHPQIDPAKTRLQGCQFLKVPLHASLERSPFESWDKGLEALAEQASKISFDLAIVGAGAWSLPLLAKIKELGKSGIHLGGDTQLIFGIKGKRWDSYGIYNEHWIRPPKPANEAALAEIDQGSYW